MSELPKFQFPSGGKGWFIILTASVVGMLAGGATIILMGKALS
jgi:hypothetical protein